MSATKSITKPKINLTLSTEGDAIGNFGDLLFSAKVLPVGSEGGIDNGRVLSLLIDKPTEGVVVWYNSVREDGAWAIRPSAQYENTYRELLHALENLPSLLSI